MKKSTLRNFLQQVPVGGVLQILELKKSALAQASRKPHFVTHPILQQPDGLRLPNLAF